MSVTAARRFYSDVACGPADGGHTVLLDGRAVRTPAARAFSLPTAALAAALAEEWRSQEKTIAPETMPLTRLACTAIDRVAPAREATIEQVSAYGASDLLCYRADGPADLVDRQSAQWQPLLDWAADTLGAPLAVVEGIVPAEQSAEALAALRRHVAAQSDFGLTGLAEMTQITGSLVLSLAVVAGRLTWRQAFEASRIDEAWQAEQWGEDGEAAKRTTVLSRDMEAAARFFQLAGA